MEQFLSNDPNGTRRVLFFGPDGRRHAVRLGKLNKKQADSVRLRIEHLANAARTRLPLDAETAAWVGTVGDDLAAKLAAVGLIPARQSQSLRAFLEA